MHQDPTATGPQLYKVTFENERVRVLECRDHPGDSEMVALSAYQRKITVNGTVRPVELDAHHVQWLPAQNHVGHNVGTTDTQVLFVELT